MTMIVRTFENQESPATLVLSCCGDTSPELPRPWQVAYAAGAEPGLFRERQTWSRCALAMATGGFCLFFGSLLFSPGQGCEIKGFIQPLLRYKGIFSLNLKGPR